MHVIDLIAKKRDGKTLNKEEITFLIDSYTNGNIPDYQMSAFLMATYFNGMSHEEATHLALSMRDSGDVLDLSMIKGVKVDKHSTGGVGDKVTLVLAPLVASVGAKVAKMSGRGLGHTGGTIDKLESIPGFKVELTREQFIKQVKDIGIAVVGQSGEVAPADKKLYALRDVTATVDVIPLIASSIMSKKLASGADAIVLDVKVGKGAFMQTIKEARELATLMVNIGKLAGKQMTAILTGMDEPLGHKIGNALEVVEAIDTLKGNGPADFIEVVMTIAQELIIYAGITNDMEDARKLLNQAINDGSAYAKFVSFVKAQDGDVSTLEHFDDLLSKHTVELKATKDGYITTIDALTIGKAAMRLGAGRETKQDQIDLSVGVDLHVKVGYPIKKGQKIATLYVNNKGVDEASKLILGAVEIGPKPNVEPLVKEIIR